MSGSTINLSLRLEIAVKKEGSVWLAWCPPLDVMTQAETKATSIKSLKEAVHLWFESCIERGVLDKALKEAGFSVMKQGERAPKEGSFVAVRSKARSFSDAGDYIDVSIPAYIAGRHIQHIETRAPR